MPAIEPWKANGETPVLLQTEGLTKVYPGVDPVYAIRELDLTIRQGEFISIIGPSGSGKSTLMNLLGLLDQPTSGSLRYKGEETARWSQTEASRFRNQEIGFVFQAHLLLPEFSALENVLMPARINGRVTEADFHAAETLLTRMGLADRMHFRPGSLSGGQNQRVAIARALVNRPSIVFADEPTGALDFKTSQSVYELMREINHQDRVTFVIVTHERTLAEKADRVLHILDGRLESDELRPSSAVF
jgi:lipoprotein-releasing system ATP-binding protein